MAKAPTAVAKVEPAQQDLSAYAQYDDGSAIDQNDLLVPFIGVLQAMSPAVAEGQIDGAKPGMLVNSVTKDLYDPKKGLVFLPVKSSYEYVEWIPREAGGGIAGRHDPGSQLVRDAMKNRVEGKLQTRDGNELVETHYVYGLIMDDAGEEVIGFGVIPCTSTKISPKKAWMTSIQMAKGTAKIPTFAFRSVVKTVSKKNRKGAFYTLAVEPFGGNWKTTALLPATSPILAQAVDFAAFIAAGRVKLDEAAEASERASGAAGAEDEAAPF